MNETKITLEYPITAGGKLITEISLRRPKVKDQIASEKAGFTDAEREVYLIGNLAGLALQEMHELDMADYARAQEVLKGFFSLPPSTSAKQSS